jgi:glutaredoxin 3
MAKIIIYSKETCHYCVMAKNLINQKGVSEIEEIRVDLYPEQDDGATNFYWRITYRWF